MQVTGRDAGPNYAIAQQLEKKIARIPGAVDVHIHQVVDAPELRINVDRVKAGQLGLTQTGRRQQPADFAERQRARWLPISG